MRRFVIVDLFDQASFLPPGIVAPPERFIAWLRQFGEVDSWPVAVSDDGGIDRKYAFRSPYDRESSFWFDEAGGLHVDRDASVIRSVFQRIGLLVREQQTQCDAG